MSATVQINPMLIGQGLPPFDQIQPEQIVPGVEALLAALNADLEQLETTVEPTWSGLVEPLTQIEERLTWSWGIVGHLMGVKNSPESKFGVYFTVLVFVFEKKCYFPKTNFTPLLLLTLHSFLFMSP